MGYLAIFVPQYIEHKWFGKFSGPIRPGCDRSDLYLCSRHPYEEHDLLGCYDVSGSTPTFRENVHSSSSGSNNTFLRNVSGLHDVKSQKTTGHRCENLKSSRLLFHYRLSKNYSFHCYIKNWHKA
jgi:hypothetical protein